MKLTDAQIAELALRLDVFNSKDESLSDDFLDSGGQKKAMIAPEVKPFDIESAWEIKFKYDEPRVGEGGILWFEPGDLAVQQICKERAILIAKHFKLTAEDLK